MDQKELLELMPYAAFICQDGAVAAVNTQAHNLLPVLEQGAALPESLRDTFCQGNKSGSFRWEERSYLYSRSDHDDHQVILLMPGEDSCITGSQLDGFSRQMRQCLGELFNQIQLLAQPSYHPEDPLDDVARLSRSFNWLTHLVSDLDFLNISRDSAQELFSPDSVDLAALCEQFACKISDLLDGIDTQVRYERPEEQVCILGDPALLERMALCLVSNAAKAAPGGTVTLRVSRQDDRAVFTVADSGEETVDLARLTQSPDADHIPTPDEGAGMGLEVARRIAALHGGTVLILPGLRKGLICAVSLPIDPNPAPFPLCVPAVDSDSGVSPLLSGLAELLPPRMFRPEFD